MGDPRKFGSSTQRGKKRTLQEKQDREVQPMRVYTSLPILELTFYILVWISSALGSAYTSYLSAHELRPKVSNWYFKKGWSIFGKEKDNTDYEWSVYSVMYIEFIPWLIAFVTLSQLIWWKVPQLITYYYVVFSTVCLQYFLGWLPTIFIFCQPLLMFVVHLTGRKSFCWAAGLSIMVLIFVHPFNQLRESFVSTNTPEGYITLVVTTWIHARSLTFCLHRCTEKRKPSSSMLQDLMLFLGFCSYFPLLYSGPLMMFDDFEKQITEAKPKWTAGRFLYLVTNIMRYIFWYFFNEFILHHVYIWAVSRYPPYVREFSAFGMCGLGYVASQFFMTKYSFLYGLSGSIARIENYKPPPPPKCISRIHRYSDMWRYFDHGLYTFLKRYIYLPIIGENPGILKKFVASGITFVYIYIWHGTTYVIFLWSLLNYIGIVLEVVASSVGSSDTFVRFEAKYLTPRWTRRLSGFIATPVLMMSALSNFYFFLGYEVGTIIVDRIIFQASALNLCVTIFVMYCACQVCIEVRKWELPKLQKKKE